MMKILAIETSTNACSVSITDGINVFNWFEVVGNQHAKMLLPKVEKLLLEAQLSLSDLDLLAFGVGPGSFTGLRIGASIIQGISIAHNIKVAGVSSLQALSLQASNRYPNIDVLSLIDARMSEVYMGFYSHSNQLIGEEIVINPSSIKIPDSEILMVGTGAKVYENTLREQFPKANFDIDILYPRAEEISKLASQIPVFDNELPLPQYIRNNVTDRSQQ